MNAPTEDKTENAEAIFCAELEDVFNKFPK
jgi:hypothetical protein